MDIVVAILIVAVIIKIVMLIYAYISSNWLASFLILLILLLIYLTYLDGKKKEAQDAAIRMAKKRAMERMEQEEIEQQNAIKKIDRCNTSCENYIIHISECINLANKSLDRAESEFTEGLFSPFWDAIEKSAYNLAKANQAILNISELRCIYKKEICKIKTTPPVFSVDSKALPDPTWVSHRMDNIVRIAQRNFQFATIYEQRKTNQLLESGFQNLGQALSDLSVSLEDSFNKLTASISEASEDIQSAIEAVQSEVAKSSQEMSKNVDAIREHSQERSQHEEKVRKMLDNIQRHRKPRSN